MRAGLLRPPLSPRVGPTRRPRAPCRSVATGSREQSQERYRVQPLARLLRDGDLQEVGPAVIGAARAFLVGG